MEDIKLVWQGETFYAAIIDIQGEVMKLRVPEQFIGVPAQQITYLYEQSKETLRILRQEGTTLSLYLPHYLPSVFGERRKYPRYAHRATFELVNTEGRTYFLDATNISLKGAGFAEGVIIPEGDYYFTVHGELFTGQLSLRKYRNNLMGCHFFGLSRRSMTELRKLLLSCEMSKPLSSNRDLSLEKIT